MGGEGPYVKLNESHRQAYYRSGPYPLDDKELDETYIRAHGFLLQRVRQLVELGWEQRNTDDSLLACVGYTRTLETYNGDRQCRVELRLPRTANTWSDPLLVQQWKAMFESWDLFLPRRHRWRSDNDRYSDAYLYVDVEAPLRDVFNFIQCLVPDMIVIIRVDDIGDLGEKEITQRLPSSKWVEDYAEDLRPIFGEDRFRDVVRASEQSATLSRMVSSYLEDEYEADDRLGDFTACDSECGYCGRCPY